MREGSRTIGPRVGAGSLWRFVLIPVLGAISCASVEPWQREALASRAMQPPFADTGMSGAYRAKLIESKTAGGLPGNAPGGGCGCTQ